MTEIELNPDKLAEAITITMFEEREINGYKLLEECPEFTLLLISLNKTISKIGLAQTIMQAVLFGVEVGLKLKLSSVQEIKDANNMQAQVN